MAKLLGAIHRCRCPSCQRRPRAELAQQHRAIHRVLRTLKEKGRRLFVGLLARQRKRGGIVELAAITGLSRTTIRRGMLEIQRAQPELPDRVRRPGGGRPRVEKKIPRPPGRLARGRPGRDGG